MADNFHHSAFILELFQFILLNNLLFDFFNSNDRVLPSALVNKSIAAFGNFLFVSDISKRDFIVLDEGPGFVRKECSLVTSIILLKENLLELALQILGVRSSLF
jgi:hypothetical protein